MLYNIFCIIVFLIKIRYNIIMRKTYKYRIYPSKSQEKILTEQLEICRKLYNTLLLERKTAYETNKETISMYAQHKRITELKEIRADMKLNSVYSQVLQDVAMRIDLAFKAFFRRIKNKKISESVGYPRFKGYGRYDSITYKQYGNGIKILDESVKGKINVSKVGHIKTTFHRKLESEVKTVVISKSSTNKWYVSFSCELDQKLLPKSNENIGIDVGLETFAYMSDDSKIDNPRFFRKEEKSLAKSNRKLAKFPKPSKEKRSSKKREKAKKTVCRIYERIKFKRENFVHQETRKIINKYQIIAIEDLRVNGMMHNHCLAKSISDASWSLFFSILDFKAEEAGRSVIKVNPAYTSQDCSQCGHREKKLLSTRIHKCNCCGLTINRDLNASINILRIGLDSLGIQSLEANDL